MADVPVKKEDTTVTTLKNVTESGTVTNAQMSKIIGDAVAEALKIAIPAAAVGINQANMAATNEGRAKLVKEAMKRTQRCHICGLPVSACGGAFARDAQGNEKIERDANGIVKLEPSVNHIKYYCGPKDDSLFRWFQGVMIGGVRFLSDYVGHQIWIPIKSDIPTLINNWERNEKELSHKRQAEGNGAGAVLPGGQVVRGSQNAIGWR